MYCGKYKDLIDSTWRRSILFFRIERDLLDHFVLYQRPNRNSTVRGWRWIKCKAQSHTLNILNSDLGRSQAHSFSIQHSHTLAHDMMMRSSCSRLAILSSSSVYILAQPQTHTLRLFPKNSVPDRQSLAPFKAIVGSNWDRFLDRHCHTDPLKRIRRRNWNCKFNCLS